MSRAPTGMSTPSTSAIARASRSASGTPRVGMPSSDQALGAAVGLQHLVGHPGAGPGDLVGVQHQA